LRENRCSSKYRCRCGEGRCGSQGGRTLGASFEAVKVLFFESPLFLFRHRDLVESRFAGGALGFACRCRPVEVRCGSQGGRTLVVRFGTVKALSDSPLFLFDRLDLEVEAAGRCATLANEVRCGSQGGRTLVVRFGTVKVLSATDSLSFRCLGRPYLETRRERRVAWGAAEAVFPQVQTRNPRSAPTGTNRRTTSHQPQCEGSRLIHRIATVSRGYPRG